MPTEDHEEMRVDVEAGTWISRFIADSNIGLNYLCHTLWTNVTVNLEIDGGNELKINWANSYINMTKRFDIYVHQQDDDVILEEFGIRPVAKTYFDKKVDLINGKKAKVVPKVIQHADSTGRHKHCRSLIIQEFSCIL